MLMNAAQALRAPVEVDASVQTQLKLCAAKPAGLTDHLNRLRASGMRLRFRRNEAIFRERDDATHIYSVAAGCVRLCRHVADGRRHISDFMFAADIFGIGQYQEYPFAAEAVNNVTVLAFPRAAFDRLGENDPTVRTDLMAHYSAMLLRTHQHLFMASCLSARERVATFIRLMSENDLVVYGDRIDLPMNRQEIADHLGLTIETICRSLAAFRDDGIIEVPNSHQLILKRPEALRSLTEARYKQ